MLGTNTCVRLRDQDSGGCCWQDAAASGVDLRNVQHK